MRPIAWSICRCPGGASSSSSEASSIAGRKELGNLIVFYDHNEISIEDDTNIALSEDVAARYEAYGWHVQKVDGGENEVLSRVGAALRG